MGKIPETRIGYEIYPFPARESLSLGHIRFADSSTLEGAVMNVSSIKDRKSFFPRFGVPDLQFRAQEPELMDDFSGDTNRLYRTLRQFAVLNATISRSRKLFAQYILGDMLRREMSACTVAEIGAGGGDFALWISSACRKAGVRVTVLAVDYDPRIAAFARAAVAGDSSVKVVESDWRDLDDNNAPIHYVYSNHFLHHLSDSDISEFLKRTWSLATHGILINDLHRSASAYIGWTILSSLLFRRSYTFSDGRTSIRKAFTLPEMTALIEQGGLANDLQIHRMPPSRLVVSGTK